MPFDLPEGYLLGLVGWLIALAASLVALLKWRRRLRLHAAGREPRRVLAGLSLWIFLASLTVVELYFAIVYDQTDAFNMSNVSQHWFARHVHANAEGFRDAAPFPRSVPAGKRRIAFVGDSFTFGHGIKNVADRFSDRVGARLEAVRPGKYIEANISSTGIHVQLITNLVEKIVGRGYQIDVLVYTICLNDIEAYEPAIDEMQQHLDLHAPKFFLFRDTYFLNMLYFRLQQARLPEVRSYYSQLADSYRGAPWQGMRSKLDELREYCAKKKIDLRIVIFPFLHNLGPEYPFDAAHEKIAEYCREAHLRCLDLKPVLLPHVAEGLTVNRFDAHPNERAHALAAQAIETDLLDDLFTGDLIADEPK
ncbi:MAG TPA: SGNH/GDSL hydrolase family protein [Planctomycetaceae bacterium]|jgi:lysophospholipase L1-like esterase